ncbi:MAG: hypothetical protein WCS01_13475 [bacterium]
MQKHIVACLLVSVLVTAFGCSSTPNHDRAIEIGRNYSTTLFDLTLTGTRPLGTNENYRMVGHILPIRKRVTLGERFELSRGDIISVSGVLTEIDRDHLRFVGHFRGVGPAQRPLDVDIDMPVSMGIHGGNLYFRDPRNLYAAAGGNDYLEIDKIEKKDLPNQAIDSDKI